MVDVDDFFLFNTVLLVVASSLAIVLTSCLWHYIHPVHALRGDGNPSSFHTTSHQQSSSATPSLSVEKDQKSARSKERRRRGKDPFRDLLKGGKKSKALLMAINVADHEHPPPSLSVPGGDSASSTSRSQSPESPRLCTVSDDGSSRIMITNTNTLAVTSPEDSPSDACSHTDIVPPDSITATDAEVNISSASTIMIHASEAFEPVVDTRTPEPRISQAVSTSGSCAELFRARTRLRMSKMDQTIQSPLISSDSVASPFPSIREVVPSPLLSIVPSTHSIDGAGPSTPTNSRGPTPPPPPSKDPSQGDPNTQPLDAHIQLASLRNSLEAAQLREEQLRLEARQASKERDELCWRWNEDAGVWRSREAELQAQIHHLMSQLQAYAAVAVSSGFSSPSPSYAHASPRLQHPSLAPFPLPPAIHPQNSASAPAHVQALLASAPMLRSHPVGFAAPATGGFYSGAGVGMSPLLWSGLGLCVPNRDTRHGRQTPDSSASGSSSRGRRRRRRTEDVKSTSDESSTGDWGGIEDGSAGEEEEEDIFSNNALADAILKRPESIRELSGNAGKRSGIGRASSGGRSPNQGGIERMDALKDPALEQQGFIFPAIRTVSDVQQPMLTL